MKPSEIYREAARLMEKRGGPAYSCWMINYVSSKGAEQPGYLSNGCRDYRRQYEATILGDSGLMFSDRNERVLALSFMAAIAEDEERSRKRRS